MKKSSIKYIFLVFFVSAISGCTKLDDKLYSNIASDQFTPTSNDLVSLMGPSYSSLRGLMMGWNGLYDLQEISADALVIPARPNGWVDGGVYKTMHMHTFNAVQPHAGAVWSNCYSGITNCNRVIYQIETDKIPVPVGKENVLAEIKTLRALYYHILCDVFGNVPIVTQFDVEPGFLPVQSTRKEVYDFIIKEVTENISLLNDKADASTYGRMNKWAAYGLLAKMYLNAEVYTGQEEWQKTIDACDEIINNTATTGYKLDANMKDVFKTDNAGSKEIVFAIPFDEKYATGFWLHNKTLQPVSIKSYDFTSEPWGGICAIPQFVRMFDPDDQRYKDTWIQGPQFDIKSGEQLVGQYAPLAGKPLSFVNKLPGIDNSTEGDGFRLGKYEFKLGALFDLSNDVPLFRYADVLMMKAEALLRSGKAVEAAAIVTQVRERSFRNNPAKATVTGADLVKGSAYEYGISVDDVIQNPEGGDDIPFGRFLDELGYEFAMEGRRRQDLIRFGVFTRKSWLSHTPNGDFRTVFPIPEAQLTRNPNLVQNAGY